MSFGLTLHARGYGISCDDCLLSFATLLSAVPYANRHWDLSNRSLTGMSRLGHRVIAILQAIPVAGLVFALIERIAACVYNTFSPAPVPIPPSARPILSRIPLANRKTFIYKELRTFNGKSSSQVLRAIFDVRGGENVVRYIDANLQNRVVEACKGNLSASRDQVLEKAFEELKKGIAKEFSKDAIGPIALLSLTIPSEFVRTTGVVFDENSEKSYFVTAKDP